MYTNKVVRIGSIIIFHLNKLWKIKFFIPVLQNTLALSAQVVARCSGRVVAQCNCHNLLRKLHNVPAAYFVPSSSKRAVRSWPDPRWGWPGKTFRSLRQFPRTGLKSPFPPVLCVFPKIVITTNLLERSSKDRWSVNQHLAEARTAVARQSADSRSTIDLGVSGQSVGISTNTRLMRRGTVVR